MTFREWAAQWGVPLAAVMQWEQQTGEYPRPTEQSDAAPRSEAWVSSVLQLEAARANVLLFRNNVGALQDKTGRWVRFGLANESEKINEKFKSSDWIGIRPVLIEARHVGHTLGQFIGREAKPEGWVYTGVGREPAQLAFANLVNAYGGDAAFCAGAGSL